MEGDYRRVHTFPVNWWKLQKSQYTPVDMEWWRKELGLQIWTRDFERGETESGIVWADNYEKAGSGWHMMRTLKNTGANDDTPSIPLKNTSMWELDHQQRPSIVYLAWNTAWMVS